MKFSLVIPPWAKADIREAADWYDQQRKGLGKEFLESVDEVFESLRHTPRRHQVVKATVRRACLRRFPYSVYYLVEGTKVEIVGVIHSKRDPSVWKERI